MAGEMPLYLPVGTEVSAKYRGAFCEAKIKKVVKCVKCKVSLIDSHMTIQIQDDDVISGPLKHGATIEVKHPDTGEPVTGILGRVMDQSVYTVVFDDGDENTLRRSQLCPKGEKHFVKTDTLDELPLTHPEHFGTPVMRGVKVSRRKGSSAIASSDSESEDESSDEEEEKKRTYRGRLQDLIGRVLCMEMEDRKKTTWVPVLVVQPSADQTELKSRDHLLVKSFRDSKFYAVSKRETKEFQREMAVKNEDKMLKGAFEKALLYFDTRELPQNWGREELLGADSDEDDYETSDDEPSEDKDRFVAQLFKFMDDRGTPINKAPTVANRDLNLYKLFRLVQILGGYNKVTNQVKWRMVYSKLGLPPSSTASNQIKAAYKKYLHAFEDFYRKLGSTMGTITRPRNRHSSGRSLLSFRERDRESTPKSPQSGSGPKKDKDFQEIKDDERNKNKDSDTESTASLPKTEPKTTRSRTAESERKVAVKDDTESETDSIKSRKDEKKSLGLTNKEKEIRITNREELARIGQEIQREKEKEESVRRVLREDVNRATPRREDEKRRHVLHSTGKDEERSREEREPPERDDKEEGRQPKKRGRKKGSGEDEDAAESKKKGNEGIVEKKLKEECVVDMTLPPGLPSRRRARETKDDTASEVSEKIMDSDKDLEEDIPSRVKTYSVGARLKVRYGKGKNSKLYEAKIVEREEEAGSVHYKVHYAGWNVRYDEWIRKDRIVSCVEEPKVSKGKPGEPVGKTPGKSKTMNSMNKANLGEPVGRPKWSNSWDKPKVTLSKPKVTLNKPKVITSASKPKLAAVATTPKLTDTPTKSKFMNSKAKAAGGVGISQFRKRLVRSPLGSRSTGLTLSTSHDRRDRESGILRAKSAGPLPSHTGEPSSAIQTSAKPPRPTRSTSVESNLITGLPVKRRPRQKPGTSFDQQSHVSSESDESDEEMDVEPFIAKNNRKPTIDAKQEITAKGSKPGVVNRKLDLDEPSESPSESEKEDEKPHTETSVSLNVLGKSPKSEDITSADILKQRTEVKLEVLPDLQPAVKKEKTLAESLTLSPQKLCLPREDLKVKVDLWDCKTKVEGKPSVPESAKLENEHPAVKRPDRIYDFEDSSSQDSYGDVTADIATKLSSLECSENKAKVKRKDLITRKRKLSTDSRASEECLGGSESEKVEQDLLRKSDTELPTPVKVTRQMVSAAEPVVKDVKEQTPANKAETSKDPETKEKPTLRKPGPKPKVPKEMKDKADGEKVEKPRGKPAPKPPTERIKAKRRLPDVGAPAENTVEEITKKKARRKRDQKEDEEEEEEDIVPHLSLEKDAVEEPIIEPEPSENISGEMTDAGTDTSPSQEEIKQPDISGQDDLPLSPTFMPAPTLTETLDIETKQVREDSDEPAPQLSPIPGTSAALAAKQKPDDVFIQPVEEVLQPQPEPEEAPVSPKPAVFVSSPSHVIFDNTPPDTPENSPAAAVPQSGNATPSQEEESTTKSEQEANLEVEAFMSIQSEVPPPGAESPNACDTSTISNGSGGSSGNAPGSESEGPFTGTKSKEEDEEEEEKVPPKKKCRGHHKRGSEKGNSKKHTPKHNMSDSDEAEASKQAEPVSPEKKPESPKEALPEPPPPRRCKYNFLDLDEGKYLEGEERIQFLMGKITDLRKIYMQLKAEVQTIDRRRKRHRRKEREAAAAAMAHLSAQALTELAGT